MMQFENLVCSAQTRYTTVEVAFTENAKAALYTYKASLDLNLQEGDAVVVPAAGKFQIVKVVRVHKAPKLLFNEEIRLLWVVQKIDFTAYKAAVEAEEVLREKLEDIIVLDMRAKAVQQFTLALSPEALEQFKLLKAED